MRGHVKQRSKGTWSIVIDVGIDPDTGKRKQQWYTVKGARREADAKLREMLDTLEKGVYVRPNKVTLGEWMDEWLNSYAALHVSPRTIESYREQIKRHIIPVLGAIPLAQLQPHNLEKYYAQKLASGRVDGKGGLSATTVRYQHALIYESLKDAVKKGIAMRNVAAIVDPPRRSHDTKLAIMNPEQVKKFLEAAKETPYYYIFYTALHTGMRRGELLGLRWGDVDLDFATLSVVQTIYKSKGKCIVKEPKNASSRRAIALTPNLAILLRKYRGQMELDKKMLGVRLKDSDLVFSYFDGKPFDPSTLSHTFSKVMVRAGVPHIRFHDLRHTHATLMLKAGIHPKVVGERLGHSNIRTTIDTYSHVLPGLQEAAARRFDEMLDESNSPSQSNISK
jgi:integrase